MNDIFESMSNLVRWFDAYTDRSMGRMPENRMLDPDYSPIPPEGPKHTCAFCGGGIFEGERYLENMEDIYCEHCYENNLIKVA